MARCRPATADSEEPGSYAEAAVDGSRATAWAPDAATAALTVDLGQRRNLKVISVGFTDAAPASSRVEVSLDGRTWTAAPPADASGRLKSAVRASYVRVTITRAGDARTGVEELVVTG